MKDGQLWSRKVRNGKVQGWSRCLWIIKDSLGCAKVLEYGQGCFGRVNVGQGLPNMTKKALFWEVLNGEGRSRMFKIVQRYLMMANDVHECYRMVKHEQ